MAQDWFRKTTWTAEDQADFRQRLARARKDNRAQYVRIQALTLSEQGQELLPAAIALYDEVITLYPCESQLAMAYGGKGQCLEKLGRIDAALASYLQAIAQMRAFPNMNDTAPLDFAWLVARKGISVHFQTALGVLDEFRHWDIFPVGRFKYYGSRALILNALDESSAAREALTALAAAEEQTSGLRYHPLLGLVGGRFIAERALLAKIAGEPNWMLTLLSYVNRCLGR